MNILSKEQISNLPEWLPVRDFPKYEVNCREGLVRNARTLKVLKPCLNIHGYPIVGLCKNGKHYSKNVHRIVANAAFGYYKIQTDDLDVCHIDEERHDFRIMNLALGSRKENLNFEKAKQRISDAKKGKHHSKEARKKISEAQKGKYVSEDTKKKISESLKGRYISEDTRKKISEAMKGERNHNFGKHKSAETRKKISEAQPKKAVGAYKNGELVMAFQSATEASRNGFHRCHVSECCRGKLKNHKGYVWKYLTA